MRGGIQIEGNRMKIINRHKSCIGITLFRLFNLNIELWYCPRGFKIEPHSHPEEDIQLMYLFGKTTFYLVHESIGGKRFIPKWYHFGHCFSVPAGFEHWFVVSKWPLIFINFAKF